MAAIVNELLPQIQITVLGKFQLIWGETLITEKVWTNATKPQVLLKALATKGVENVLIDLLMQVLWPDTSRDTENEIFESYCTGSESTG